MFVYMGKLVTQGGRIGAELIDNKFPTVGLMTSAVRARSAISGRVTCCFKPRWRWAACFCWRGRRGEISANMPSCRRRCSRWFISISISPSAADFSWRRFRTFFSILAACAAIEAIARNDWRDSLLVGLAAGAAAMVKPSGLAALGAFAIAMAWQQRRDWRRLSIHATAAAAGLAIPAIATVIYFHAADLFAALPGIWRQIADYAANSPWEPWDLSKPVIVLLIVGFPMLVRGVVFRRPQHRVGGHPGRAILPFALLWMAMECTGIVAQRRMYAYHFLVLAAPASVLFGLIPRRPRVLPMAAALVLPAAFSIFGACQVLADAPNSLAREPSEDYLAAHAQPGDAVWMDGMMRLLVVTDLQPGSRYPMTFLWVNDDEAPLRYCRDMLGDFDQRRPEYIVIPTDFELYGRKLANRIKELGLRPQRKANFIRAWMDLGDYVRKNYHPEARLAWETIYRRGT